MTEEIWKPVIGYEGRYEVSDLGRVRSIDHYVRSPKGRRLLKGHVLTLSKRGGYSLITLCDKNTTKKVGVANLVLRMFVGPVPVGMEVCHENGVQANCCLSNLRYDTHANNIADKVRHGTDNRGEKHPLSKLHPDDVRQIRMMEGMGSQRAIGELFGLSQGHVWRIMTGKSWAYLE